jgi:hypothetical protein
MSELEINNYQPYPAAAISMDTPVDSLGERYRSIVEFDLSSVVSYDAFVTKYPTAWDAYYGPELPALDAPSYSPENALKLQEAVKFYLYMNEGETINVEPYDYGGLLSDGDNILVTAPSITPYAAESGGAYENPNAFYDQDVYDRVTNNGTEALPLLEMDSARDINARAVDKPQLLEMYSTEQLAMKEYEVSRNTPVSDYDWGGSYATGRNTY